MAADLAKLHPGVTLELSDEFPHLHRYNGREI